MNKKMHGRENDSVEVVQDVPKSDVAKREEEMLAFWNEHDIFNKSVETPAGDSPKGDFVFYDGPPFATGLPHYGHLLQSALKDAIPRFWTMNGYRVERKWGWDCHGLPLENLIEKELGLGTKRDIEEYGIKNFNEKARGAVMRYADDWRQIIPRIGRFVDMENDYKTMDSTYTESVWWVFKSLHEKGLVFEGFKSMHLCPRCGTTLSNFEVNQGYKDIKDIAVTVRLPLLDDEGNETDTNLLVWTTTPWTLPGNTAAAVNKEITYVKARVSEVGVADVSKDGTYTVQPEPKIEFVILAKGRLAQLDDATYEVIEEMKGADLVGKKYKPPFAYMQNQNLDKAENAWTIYHADYVEVGEEGTGAVHIAPAYGDDDMQLAQANEVPIYHHVDESGRFKDFVTDFAGRLVKPKDDDDAKVDHKDTDIEILRALQATGKIFKKENITHSYPHCWRCDTPLLNYATTSWFVRVPDFKDKLVAENEKVNWVPEHVGKNRFGKWLEGARDWAVSRQRYWGAPLPIWKNPESGEYKVFGSLADLQEYVPKSGNKYFAMRHGESEKNVIDIVTDDPNAPYPLTEKGKADTVKAAAELKGKIDLIITSPVLRAKETAELFAKELGLSAEQLLVDERIREAGHGEFEGKSLDEYYKKYPADITRFDAKPEGGENWTEIKQRMGAFLYDLENTYKDKNILIVSHGDPLAMLYRVVDGLNREDAVAHRDVDYPVKGEVRELNFVPMPHNDDYELDFHRPYIDDVVLEENGVKLERIPDVFDCWFESGSMPYGQKHYPFACEDTFEKDAFPAEFIGEGLDQTRGWFYSMIVLGVALFDKSPYKNVVTNGLILAEDGRKMSKSLQNYPDPMELVARVGADAMRFYLLSSPVIKGEDLNFSEKEVTELQRKNIGRLHNVLQMYEMFADGTEAKADSENVLDKWIVSRLNQLIAEATAGYKQYELDKATRPITDFVDDLSVWYLRRSRDRLKGDDVEDKARALATLRYTLRTLALVMAPVMPFYAEYLWQGVKEESDAESVHLGKWPQGGVVDEELLQTMEKTRDVVTAALEARTKAGIKVRQPIAKVTGPELSADLQQVVLEELNAKTYETTSEIGVDTNLTPELIAEGDVRELMRAIQGMRKKEGLEPADEISLTIQTTEEGKAAIEANKELLMKTVGAVAIGYADTEGETVEASSYSFTFSFKKN